MLHSLQIKGALVNKEQKYSKREILDISNIAMEHESLIVKWLELLKKNKYIKCDDELYYGADIISGMKLNKCWDKVRNIWKVALVLRKLWIISYVMLRSFHNL